MPVLRAFSTAPRRLALSGTPFRSDTRAIPFVRYVLDEASPDFEYGYGEALADRRVVRPVYFPRTNGHMEWSAPDGSLHAASFDDALDQARSSQRLRTALSLEGEWLPVGAAGGRGPTRRGAPGAARCRRPGDRHRPGPRPGDRRAPPGPVRPAGHGGHLRRSGGVGDLIARFASGTDPWLVSVRMVSEGVDIPRLRVGVYATTTTTELFFRQAVGRFVRWTPGTRDQKAYVFIPDDPRLRSRAFQIADQRRHSLRRREQERFERDPAALDTGAEEQLSLFAALSAVATDHQTHAPFASADEVDDDLDASLDDDPTLVLDLAPPPPLAGDRRSLHDLGIEFGGDAARTRREEKRRLREQNAEIVGTIARRTGQTHAQVNAELNRLSGVGRITEATVAQLRTRLEVAERLARR
jgi:superfamily II DNA or RNA helicase